MYEVKDGIEHSVYIRQKDGAKSKWLIIEFYECEGIAKAIGRYDTRLFDFSNARIGYHTFPSENGWMIQDVGGEKDIFIPLKAIPLIKEYLLKFWEYGERVL